MWRGRWGRRPATVAGAVLLVLVTLAGCGGGAGGSGADFTGRCVGGTLLVSELYDPVDLIGVAVDPLHVVVRTDPATVPRLGDQVTVVTDALTPPGITAIVTAAGRAAGDGVPLTVGVSPDDQLARTFVPGTPARVTLRTNRIGKSETISADSLRPVPPRLPGPSTVWLAGPGPGDGPLGGRAHPVAVMVDHVVQGRATLTSSDPPFPPFGVGGTWPIVVPDHHCTAESEPSAAPGDAREWNLQGDVQGGGLSFAFDGNTPLPRTTPPPGSPVPGADEEHRSWQRPIRALAVDDPLDADGGIRVVPTGPDRLDVTLALRWLGARPVLAEDWVGAQGRDIHRTAVGCAPASGPVGHPCSARYTIAMPPTAALTARTASAPIDVRGRAEDTDLSTDSGRVTVDDVTGDLSVTSATGDVSGTVSGRTGGSFFDAGQVTVKAGGRIDLRVAVPMRSLGVTGQGAPVSVELPRGSTWNIETDAFPRGRRDIEVPSDPGSNNLLTVRADAGGDVTVRYAP